MSMVLDRAATDTLREGFRSRVHGITKVLLAPAQELWWQHTASSSNRFPFSYYASALRGEGPDADELLVISVEVMDVQDDAGERLVVGADITTGDGMLLARSPTTTIEVPSESALLDLADPLARVGDVTKQVVAATEDLYLWIDTQRPTIERALAELK
jgi:hypothetical protein